VRRVDCSKFSDPQSRNSCRQIECLFRNSEKVGVSRAELGASGVRDQLAVVDQVRWSLTSHRLVDESGQLVVDSLLHQKPVQATKNWRVASASSRQKASRRILGRLQTPVYQINLIVLIR